MIFELCAVADERGFIHLQFFFYKLIIVLSSQKNREYVAEQHLFLFFFFLNGYLHVSVLLDERLNLGEFTSLHPVVY